MLANRVIADFGNGVQVLNGRYGPYITDGEKNARIPKDTEPKELTEAQCIELLAAAPVKKGGRFGKKTAAAKKTAAKKEPAAKKTAVKKAAAKKAPAKKTAAKKAATKKTAAKKATTKKTPA
jgi:DNA topoisomerase-1